MVINFFIISIALLVFILTVIVFGKLGKATDNKDKLIKSVKNEDVIKIERAELETTFASRFITPKIKKLTSYFEKVKKQREEKSKKVVDENKIAKIKKTERLLRMSGTHMSYQNYSFVKLAFAIIFSVITIGVALLLDTEALYTILIVMIGLMLAFVMPDFLLKAKVTSHQNAIREQLPDVLDLLSVCTGAGLSFDNALVKVVDKMDGPFIDELMTVFKQMQMGVSRADALNSLSDCTDIPELKTFASALIQASQLGIPVTNVMNVQAQQLRDSRRESARERGNKASVKMTIPIMFFIFPALFIVILGPTVINVMNATG